MELYKVTFYAIEYTQGDSFMVKICHYAVVIATSIIAATFRLYALEADSSMNADKAISLLKEGNDRYVNGKAQHLRQDQERRTITTAHGQFPYVSILSCSDSRVPLEIIFDAGIGDLFVIRVAGNVADGDETGSLEYGIGHLGSPLLLVLGHSKCGAVTAAVKNSKVGGNIPLLINKIKPAIVKTLKNRPYLTGDSLITGAISSNVWQSIEDIFKRSEEIREKVKKGDVKVIGGIYDLESGKISIMGPHPQQEKLLEFAEEKTETKHATKTESKAEPKSESRFFSKTESKSESKFHR
jgi:carbonic anhydrase